MGRRGLFLVVDGPEGSGKTTQVKRLAGHLEAAGRTVRTFREPGGTAVGERIRDVLLDPASGSLAPLTEILLFLASRAQLLEEKIRPALARGEVVLLDRFHPATIAYQVHGLARGRLPDDILAVIRAVNGGLEPDCVWLLDVPPEVGLERLGRAPDRIEGRDLEYHRRVRAGFLAQAQADPARIVVVDGTRSEDEVFRQLAEGLERELL